MEQNKTGETVMTSTVAECGEYHNPGEYHGGTVTQEESVRSNPENQSAHGEKEELSENRQKAIKRMYKLVYWFADEMFKYEDMEAQEKAEIERRCKEAPDEPIVLLCTSGRNAEVMKECMRETRDAADFLKNSKNDIEEWQIAGINAMFDQCNVEKIIPFDMPTAIKGLLCMHVLSKPLCVEAVGE